PDTDTHSLHDALPICMLDDGGSGERAGSGEEEPQPGRNGSGYGLRLAACGLREKQSAGDRERDFSGEQRNTEEQREGIYGGPGADRKSTRLNSSHLGI